jgi:hypothetical protein
LHGWETNPHIAQAKDGELSIRKEVLRLSHAQLKYLPSPSTAALEGAFAKRKSPVRLRSG